MARLIDLAAYEPPHIPDRSEAVDIREHCWRLTLLLGELDLGHEPYRAWIELASSIQGVLVDLTDSSTVMCGRAHRYESRRSDIMEALTTEIAIFSFLWNGFECLTKSVNPKGFDGAAVKRLGRSSDWPARAIHYLRVAYEPAPLIDLYTAALNDLKEDFGASPDRSWMLKNLVEDEAMGESGWGVYLVSQQRNSLAHGSADLPVPESSDGELTVRELADASRVRMCSRVLLTSMQMMLCAWLPPGAKVAGDAVHLSDEPVDIEVGIALRTLHRHRD